MNVKAQNISIVYLQTEHCILSITHYDLTSESLQHVSFLTYEKVSCTFDLVYIAC